ncbi:folate-binding protein YgfZ [bacterium]|nr:folate-binding protein YgfZ [bacterium]
MTIECSSISNPPFALLEFTGPDRNEFLHRLLSNDLMLQPGQATSAYYLSVLGRPLAQFWVFQDVQSSWLVCPDLVGEAGLHELDKMHFGEKLAMFNRTPDWHATMLVGPGRSAWLSQKLGQPAPSRWGLQSGPEHLWCRFPLLASGSDLLFTRQPLSTDLPDLSARWELERIQACRPWPTDWSEKTLLLEVAEESDYVDGKGCYPGQEVVARTLHRGHINRHICTLTGSLPQPAAGTRLKLGDKEVGWVSSSAVDLQQVYAMAFLRREAWEPGSQLQREDEGSLIVSHPRREA